MTEKLRFGIIGCGVIGPLHAEALKVIPDAELVAVADVVPEKAQKLGEKYNARAYTDAGEMLEREHLDVVDVCVPSGLHGQIAIQVMRAGSHVIIEKPIEIQHERIAEIIRVQKETGRKVAVISQHRFDPAAVQVHKLVQEGAFGRLVLGNAAIPWWRSQKYYDSGAWRGTWELDGGGILMNQSIHSIDVLQWLMGPVKSIRAYTDTLVHQMETEDVAVAVLRFANGALGTISATTGGYPGAVTRIEIFGDKGSAIIENDRLGYLHLARDDQEELGPYGGAKKGSGASTDSTTAKDPAALQANTHAQQITNMIQAIREDGTPLVDAQAGRHPVEIILGVYEAARTGKEIVLS
ncbi:MAG TPA: Gfo/Idh/MocA family oxidoreductase [Ktedonobacteraceae bacterium]|jgi:predicted dehydrogenase|nr:Gfo/Idh/MocA family oxidoreductase [Ktedonobacteraceae bacterium]